MTSSTERFDEIRRLHPQVGLCVYALDANGPVTLELHMPDGKYFSFPAATLQDALGLAFPPDTAPQYVAADREVKPAPAPAPKAPQTDIFG